MRYTQALEKWKSSGIGQLVATSAIGEIGKWSFDEALPRAAINWRSILNNVKKSKLCDYRTKRRVARSFICQIHDDETEGCDFRACPFCWITDVVWPLLDTLDGFLRYRKDLQLFVHRREAVLEGELNESVVRGHFEKIKQTETLLPGAMGVWSIQWLDWSRHRRYELSSKVVAMYCGGIENRPDFLLRGRWYTAKEMTTPATVSMLARYPLHWLALDPEKFVDCMQLQHGLRHTRRNGVFLDDWRKQLEAKPWVSQYSE